MKEKSPQLLIYKTEDLKRGLKGLFRVKQKKLDTYRTEEMTEEQIPIWQCLLRSFHHIFLRRFSHRHMLRQCVVFCYFSLPSFISYDARINRYVKQIRLFQTMLFYFSRTRASQNYARIGEWFLHLYAYFVWYFKTFILQDFWYFSVPDLLLSSI